MSQATDHSATISGHQGFPFKRFPVDSLTEVLIARHSPGNAYVDAREYQQIVPHSLEVNHGIFTVPYAIPSFPPVTVLVQEEQLLVSCTCNEDHQKLCIHEAQVLTAIVRREELGIFFNARLRQEKLKKFAVDYGLSAAPNLDAYFTIALEHKKVVITSKLPTLLAVNPDTLQAINQVLYPLPEVAPQAAPAAEGKAICVVLRQHKYHKHLLIELYSGALTKDGKIKNPLTAVPPLDLAWTSDDPDHLKFYTGIHKFQNHPDAKRSPSDLTALKAIIKNPAGYRFYYHNPEVSDNVTATSIVPVKTAILPGGITLTVQQEGEFYTVGGSLTLQGVEYALGDLSPRFTYFLQANDTLYLADQFQALGVIELLKKKDKLLVHASKYAAFKAQVLDKLEESIPVTHPYIPVATPAQLEEQGFNQALKRIIYLSDFGNYIMIIPVVRYGDVEIPIRTKKQIYATDERGKQFLVRRDGALEAAFTAQLLKQHPHFDEQLENDLHYWYLHRDRFLSEDWFLNAFEEWDRQGITVLGFNELEGNKFSPYKIKVDIKVLSGINWFNADVQVKFGKKKASLKEVYKSIRNQHKYVQLDDGTKGILPAEWIERFKDYFNNAEIINESTLRISKINFSAIDQLYEQSMLDVEVAAEVMAYKEKLQDVHAIRPIEAPAGLQATLRPYQQEGLNWLNFLDELNFGGILADDMGLGKSMQVIAFILSQRHKVQRNCNLLVVPSTLIFNWQQEVTRFAPSIKLLTVHGAGRMKNTEAFEHYEIILTSYGTLLSDISFLKDYVFNYIFLDESHNIKNPETQRYKAVRLLQSRNKIAITGTPVENNTFDLFSQLSFACPGLLGSKQYFKDVYAVPVDMFKNSKRAAELHQKVRPFILRRTKEEVAPELPDKTEMVVYCEMPEEQRKIYDAYEKEFREYISATTDEELKKSPMNVLKGLTRLRQICDSPALLGEDDLHGNASAKVDTLLEQIGTKAPQHKILVFSQFVSMLNLIKQALTEQGIGFEMLTGSTKDRGTVVNSFQQNPDKRVFLISLKAGGTGLNLTAADYVYLVDPWWNPAVENQAIDRIHRIGQDKKVIAVRLICPGTVEEKMMTMQANKKTLAEELIKTGTSLLPSLSKDDLLQLLTFQPS